MKDYDMNVHYHSGNANIVADALSWLSMGSTPHIEDMLRACVIDFKDSWDDHLPLIEFSYSNNYHSSIGIAPFETLYSRRCRSPFGWFEVGESSILGSEIIHEALEKV